MVDNKAQAFDTIARAARIVDEDTDKSAEMKLSSLLGTIYGCMACLGIEPDAEEDDGK